MWTHTETTYYVVTNHKDTQVKAFEILRDSFKNGGKLLLCGNGGSAADCDHIVGELMKGMNSQHCADGWAPLQPALPAISLCAQTALVTAIANDMGYDWVFAQQVYGYGKWPDVLLGISTSGKSMSVIRAMEFAKRKQMYVIGMTGEYTDYFDKFCNVVISCPGKTAAEIQEGHQRIYHDLCTRLEEEFKR